MIRTSLIAVTAAALLAGCATTEAGDDAFPATSSASASAASPAVCAGVYAARSRIAVAPVVARQGATLAVRVETPMGPYAPVAVPAACLSDWRVTPEGAAALSADHATLTVAADAPSGEPLEISVLASGAESGRVSRVMTLVGADEFVLTGFWSESEVRCEGGFQPAQAVRELEFRDGGGFNLTYLPFESFVDYWGRFDWDRTTGTLTFEVTGGNNTPGADLLRARASEDGGRLIVEGVFLGDARHAQAGQTCRYVFTRR